MEDLFKKISPLNLVMIILSIFAIFGFIVYGEWMSAIWAFNTLCWVCICVNKDIINKDLKEENKDLREMLYNK